MPAKASPPTDQNSFLSGIGHICLQWARLEAGILACIACAENILMEEAFNRYADQNMLPRLNTAIKLARKAQWPANLVKPLEKIRLALQRGGRGLAERRNLFVHGIQARGDNEGETKMTMVRWKGDREHVVTLLDAADLANSLALLAQEAERVFDDYGLWKFGIKNQTDRNEHVAQAKTFSMFIRAQNIKRAIKLLLANLKPL